MLGFLTIAIFWSGLPPVFAVGGIVLGWEVRHAARGRFLSRTAIVIGVIAIAGDIAVYVQDMAL